MSSFRWARAVKPEAAAPWRWPLISCEGVGYGASENIEGIREFLKNYRIYLRRIISCPELGMSSLHDIAQ